MSNEKKQQEHKLHEEHTNPPLLRQVQIRGYKSIAFCDVSLEPLTIFVGRNASVKSNFLDAMAFLRNLMEHSVDEAVNRHNGWRAIHRRNEDFPFIEMKIQATCPSYESV